MTKAPRRLRAYAMTQGRTHSDLPMDAMLSVGDSSPPDHLSPEQARIVQACSRSPQSLVDLSATLDMPIGVVRVLLADLIDGGAVDVSSQDDRAVPPHHDLALLEEVLDGIESL
ncbi:DUF742 domain-containing protein [soil metagenome]